MKKSKKIIGFTALSLALLSGAFYANNFIGSANTQSTQGYEKVVAEQQNSLKTFDDILGLADNILIGTVVSQEDNEDGAFKSTFAVEGQLKGSAENLIDVYEVPGHLEVGKKYILFLEYWEGEFYPNPVFTSVNKDAIIEIQNNNELKGAEKFIKAKNKDELVKYIKNSDSAKLLTKKQFNVVNKYASDDQLISSSTTILSIIPKEIIEENKHIKVAKIEITESFKGSLKSDTLMLPPSIEVGKEYLVFLKEKNGTLTISSREGSVISKNNSQWGELIRKIQQ
ncbi:hypothetical protein [Ammoniphilus sp. YIM 78166]|uniref:hypothetical protein n=1 Tax=Ammoniphilus sp. YIM 78166 TaxID=1644106 RepID=UPI0010703DEE|nr:hypothetical protein [Ammoniphilus sp. YIM 78166]